MRITIFIIASVLLFSCTKDSFTSSSEALLRTRIDSLRFDTVFTSVGSVTQSFKIINEDVKGIHITSVQLGGGATSPFKINIDGTPGPQVNDIDIIANDSIYVFVTVKIDPTVANLPFVVRDSIEIKYNGIKKQVALEAYGQNAHFVRNKIVRGRETWTADLPYVILGGLTIDTAAILNIAKGTHIYVHADAPVIVHGSLQASGEKWDSTRVLFASDRLDEPYRNYPAGWPGIIFTNTSKNNLLQYTTLKNAYQAIVVQNGANSLIPQLFLNEAIIDKAYEAGLTGINSSIQAQNLLVSNCSKGIVLAGGGTYNFTHCTVASTANPFIQHKDPGLFINNGTEPATQSNNLNATFRNCIFWGDSGGAVDNEVVVTKSGTAIYTVTFDHVLWRVKSNPAHAIINAAINNQAPRFDSINAAKGFYSFRLKEGSPAINKGTNTGLVIDLDGAPRPTALLPDIGAYERQ